MDDDDLNLLMSELLRAQAYRCGSGATIVNTQGDAKDDGCDGWSPRPPVKDEGSSNKLAMHLAFPGEAYRFAIGFPTGVLDKIPMAQVLSWASANPKVRGGLLARLASKDFSSDETLASQVLGTYGDDEDVRGAFFSAYVSGSWSGPASDHWEQLASLLDDVAKRTEFSKLRYWAREVAAALRKMAEGDKEREEESDVRGR